MVEFHLPEELNDDFFDQIPHQRTAVDRLLEEGCLVSYALSLEDAKLWAVFNAESEMEVMEMILEMPLSRFMEADVHLLAFYNETPLEVPDFSLN